MSSERKEQGQGESDPLKNEFHFLDWNETSKWSNQIHDKLVVDISRLWAMVKFQEE